MVELSQLLGFLTILKQSLKIFPKNGKLIASVALLSLLLPSLLFLLFVYFFESLIAYTSDRHTKPDYDPSDHSYMLKFLALVLAVEIVFLIIYFIISHLSGIATILVSAVSYTDKNLTWEDLISSIRRTWRRPLTTRFMVSGNSWTRYLWLVVVLAALLVVMYPNPITISVAVVLVIVVFIIQLHSSVVLALSVVVSVVEDSPRIEAIEKAGKLVEQGQHVHGFMLNIFINLVAVIIVVVFWMIIGVQGSVTVYGLFFVNLFSLLKMFIFVAYTVFYFQCKKHQGEDIDVFGDGDQLQYTQVPTTADDDIP